MHTSPNNFTPQCKVRRLKQLVKNFVYLSLYFKYMIHYMYIIYCYYYYIFVLLLYIIMQCSKALLEIKFSLILWAEAPHHNCDSELPKQLALGLDSWFSIRCQRRAAMQPEQYFVFHLFHNESSTSIPLLCKPTCSKHWRNSRKSDISLLGESIFTQLTYWVLFTTS